jgi:hypothetical protein
MGFSSPYGLASLVFVALLVLLHLRHRQRRDVEIPSLLLWRTVRDEPRTGRFRPNLLFALQLALLAALATAVARPYWAERASSVASGRTVFVFDVSASMQAVEAGERRFDQARRRASDLLGGLDRNTEVMMITVAAHPRVVVAFTRDRSLLARALETLEPEDGPTHLSLGIQLAHSAASGAGPLEIDVFTDLPSDAVGFAPSAGERLRYFRFGRTDDNVALAALRVYQNPFQDAAEARGYALVKNYAHRPKEVALHVALASKPILDETLHLESRESRVVAIPTLNGSGRLEAWLDVADALGVDNRALAFVRAPRTIRVLAVSDSPDLLADLGAVARAVPAMELRRIAPREFTPADAAGADVAIFHGFVPSQSPAVNGLYLYPPAANRLFRAEQDVTGAQILDWNESDPVLHDLRYVEALPLDRARIIELPSWAHTLIASRAEGREFPLAFAGETAGRRVICFAFDLTGRSLVKSQNLSLLLLLLNAMRWLIPPDPAAPLQIDVGESYREPFIAPSSLSVTRPDGRVETASATHDAALELTRAGEYRLAAGAFQRTIYANLFDGDESDIGREASVGEETIEGKGSSGAGSVVSAEFVHELERLLLIVGLGFALVEWAVWLWLTNAWGFFRRD